MPGVKNLRRGLRPLSCPCGAKVYATWAQVEQHGLPIHGCGEPFTPEEVEFAFGLGLDTTLVAEYRERVRAYMKGQEGHKNRNHTVNDPYGPCAREFEQARAKAARATRLAALRPAEPIPF